MQADPGPGAGEARARALRGLGLLCALVLLVAAWRHLARVLESL